MTIATSVEYTARQMEITPKTRKVVELGLAKIARLLGGKFDAKVVLTHEKRLHKVDIALSAGIRSLSGTGQHSDVDTAAGEALDHIASQAIKQKDRWATTKRRSQKSKAWANGEAQQAEIETAPVLAVGNKKTVVPMVVHRYGGKPKLTEAHMVRTTDKVATRPMSIEEAVKEAEFRDLAVFVFRDLQGAVLVLHRTREGKMELIEAP